MPCRDSKCECNGAPVERSAKQPQLKKPMSEKYRKWLEAALEEPGKNAVVPKNALRWALKELAKVFKDDPDVLRRVAIARRRAALARGRPRPR